MSALTFQAGLHDFFNSYAFAMALHDSKGMANHYFIPCSIISDEASNVYTEASRLEGLINQVLVFYKQSGIALMKADVRSIQQITDRIIKAKVTWVYCNQKEEPMYSFDYQYIIKPDKHNNFKIHTAISLNEKERMEHWMASRNK